MDFTFLSLQDRFSFRRYNPGLINVYNPGLSLSMERYSGRKEEKSGV
ncbi:MAG: hypothetical protein PHT07_08875 [Paludibacter sp.]|nr:hypothetical protein [Paludibacter sp.]